MRANVRFMKNLLIVATAMLVAVCVTLACKKNKPRVATYYCVCYFKSTITGKDTSAETDYPPSVNSQKSLCDSSCLHSQYSLRNFDTGAHCQVY